MRINPTLFTAICLVLVIVAITPTVTGASVTGISPTSANRGTTVTAYVYGSGFVPGTQVALMRTGAAVYATGEVIVSSNVIRCTLAIPASQATGLYGVVVQVPGQTTWNGKANAFTVNAAPAPTVTSISPTSANRGTTITAYVYGTNFQTGTQIAIAGGGTTVYATGETTLNANTVRCTLAIPSTAYIGYYSVYAQNPGTTTWVSKTNIFQVRGTTPPTVTSISPTSANRGTTIT
ncbi:MAG TPA: IPT/TIG domain-containing protein, partial [Methanoregulaceae archaeon]|nr:IPT/TIG domain-containing protein [Methanoregulaceae archaeon]